MVVQIFNLGNNTHAKLTDPQVEYYTLGLLLRYGQDRTLQRFDFNCSDSPCGCQFHVVNDVEKGGHTGDSPIRGNVAERQKGCRRAKVAPTILI